MTAKPFCQDLHADPHPPRDEALANIKEAIALSLEVRAERGLPLKVETQQVEVTVLRQGFP